MAVEDPIDLVVDFRDDPRPDFFDPRLLSFFPSELCPPLLAIVDVIPPDGSITVVRALLSSSIVIKRHERLSTNDSKMGMDGESE